MSTDYRLLTNVLADDLFGGRLKKLGIQEAFSDETTAQSRLLTDGQNFLWIYIDDAGFVSCLTRYLPNGAPGKILSAIADVFDTEIASEYEPQFWGFDTHEEWDAWQLEITKEHEEKFYSDMLKFLKDEPNDIRPGTIGMLQAQIARKLVDGDPTLLWPANKEKLRTAVQSIYDQDHRVVVELNCEELAATRMCVTHEDNLPRA